jgi:glycosyltransferase involved in cell wall biosynthesis
MMNLKVIIITSSQVHLAGGLSTHVKLLKDSLKANGHDVRVIDGAQFYRPRIKLRFAVKSFLMLKNPKISWFKYRAQKLSEKLLTMVDSWSPNIVHFHDHVPMYCLDKLILSTPSVYTCHGPALEHAKENGEKNVAYLNFLRNSEISSFELPNAIIAVDSGQKQLMADKGVNPDKIRVVYNAVDLDKLSRFATTSPPCSGSYFIIARRLAKKNGIEVAIRAFLDWVDDKDVSLKIAGDGPCFGELKYLVDSHSLGHKVCFLGSLDHNSLFPLIRHSIASIVPSVPVEGVVEATSLTAIESLALGVPVIASRIGGLIEIDGGSGFCHLFEAGDVTQLKDRLSHLYLERNQMPNIAACRIEHIKNNFDIKSWGLRHIELYQSLIGAS